MTHLKRFNILIVAGRALVVCLTLLANVSTSAEPGKKIKVLFLGDRGHHRPEARSKELIPAMAQRGIAVTYTGKVTDLNPKTLSAYDCLIVYANLDKISPDQEKAMLDFIAEGHGFVPIHCASFCFRNSTKYVELVGAQFKRHGTGVFTTDIVKPDHPVMKGFKGFETWDETYVHSKHNEKDRTVLQTRDEKGKPEPWTWVRTHGKGRVFYTAYGHDQRTFTKPGFHNLVARGIRWTVGAKIGSDKQIANQPCVPALTKRPKLKPFKYVPAKIAHYRKGPHAKQEMQLPVPAAESVKHMVLPQGFEAKLFASEPNIKKPIAMAWDARGRLWIAETVDYPNSLQPEGQGNDDIKICEDTNGDGRADKFTIFADKLSIPTSLTFANGGLIVHQAPHTLFLKDTDGDDVADVRKKIISGWSTGDTHAGPSNLRWGFDNWVWGCVGYSGYRGTVGDKKLRFGNGFYRFKPDGSELEFLRSTNNNTWGLAFSEEGLVFGSTANGNPSVFMPLPNRYYESVRGMTARRLERTATTARFKPITIKVRQVDSHGSFTAAAGHAIYTARSYPKQYWDRTALVNGPTGHLVGVFEMIRKGSDFSTTNHWNLVASDDEWTAPIMSEVGPDGAVWMIDWYNFIVQHNPIPRGFKRGSRGAYVTELRDKTHGRIYRIIYKDAKPYKPLRLDKASGEQLVAALANDNMFWRLTAQRLLVERGKKDVLEALVKLTEDTRVDEIGFNGGALHALHTMHGLGLLDGTNSTATAAAIGALKHPSAGVRRAALQTVPRTEASTNAILDVQLLVDSDAQVRLAAFLALSEMPPSQRAGAAILAAMNNGLNSDDRWIPDAATSAAARHDSGFLKAVLAGTEKKGTVQGQPKKAQPKKKSKNLIHNPSFEKVANGNPVGWRVRNYGGTATHKLVEGGTTGKYCLQISSDKGSNTSWFTDVKVKRKTKYRLTGWIKIKDIQNVRGYGVMFNVHSMGETRTKGSKGTSDWNRVQLTFNSGNRSKVSINCLFGGWGLSTGTAWYDDVSLIELGPGSGPQVASTGLSASIDHIVRVVMGHYAARGPAESVVATLSSLKGADAKLSSAVLGGLVSGWPQGKAPKLSAADQAELTALMKALPKSQRDRLLALADRWGRRDIFSADAKAVLGSLVERVKKTSLKASERVDAAGRLIRLDDHVKSIELIASQIYPLAGTDLVKGLVESLAASRRDETGKILLTRYSEITPASRRTVIGVLMRRAAWNTALLGAIESGKVDPRDLTASDWQQLTSHPDNTIRQRASQLAGKSRLPSADRKEVLAKLLPLAEKSGDVALGKQIFTKKCAQCHSIDGEGGKVAPDLTGFGRRSKEENLIDILDPNRSVEGTYRQWKALTKDGILISGLLASESQTAIVIIDVNGKKHPIARSEIESLKISSLSVMPVGLEKDLSEKDITALLEYLSSSKAGPIK